MARLGEVRSWLLMAAGEDRQFGGNSGYDDQADVYYTWDSTVNNYRNIKVGDRVALWDKRRLLGISVVEEIEETPTSKQVFRCPRLDCGSSNIKTRKTKTPKYRCQACGSEFASPRTQVVEVMEYRSRHDAAWASLDGVLLREELRALCEAPKSQLSMRPLDWDAFQNAIIKKGEEKAIKRVIGRAPEIFAPDGDIAINFPQGHTKATVRVRKGQRSFRDHLLRLQGGRCAFTGFAPERVLDAGHLYSYAALGEHLEHGGMMLRRDIHRLFDDGSLAVDPETLRVDVAESLESYPQYARLHDRPLELDVVEAQALWLSKHWAEHRA